VTRLVAEPTRLLFGPIAIGTKQSHVVLLHNKGTAPISGNVATPREPFSVGPGAGDFSLPAGASNQIAVNFVPTRVSPPGGFEATLDITYEDAGATESLKILLAGDARPS
jgi:hypothetical protein